MRKALCLLFLVTSVTACVQSGQGDLGVDGGEPLPDAMSEDASPPDAPPPDAPPGAPTLSVTATPMTINLGQSTNINWFSGNTASCTSMGLPQPLNGTYTVSPIVDTTYTVVCTGLNGVGIMDHVNVTVIQPPDPLPPTVDVSATLTTINLGQNTTVIWTSENATSCTNSQTWSQDPSGTFTVYPTMNITYAVVCSGPGGQAQDSVNVTVIQPPPPPLPTLTVTASPMTITVGGTTVVSWDSTNATTCKSWFNGGWVDQPIDGFWSGLTPTTTTVYSLHCTGPGGTVSNGVTVTVNATPPPPAPTMSMSASPPTIAVGGSSTITWSSTNTTGCNSSGGPHATSGTWTVTPTTTTTYSMTCSGPGGSITRTALVTVYALPTLNFTANPTTIDVGDSSCLSWSSSNTTSCTVNSATKPTSGSLSVSPTSTTVYTATCTGPGGSITRTVTVTVNVPPPPPAPTLSFSASPVTITVGQSSTLIWSTANATSCTATGGWNGSKPVNGTLVVSPTANAKYQLSCTGPGGTVNGTADVTVTAPQLPDLLLTFTATPLVGGGGYRLVWDSTHADTCTASNAWTGDRPVDGNIIVNPTAIATHTYTLNCTRAAGGSITKSVNVIVAAPPANTMCHGSEAFYKNSDLPNIDYCKGWPVSGVPQILPEGNLVSGPDGVCAITCHLANGLTVLPVGGSSIWVPGAIQDSARRYITGCAQLPGHATDANPPSGITWDLQCATPVTVLPGPPNTNL